MKVENITLDWLHERVIEQDGCWMWVGFCGNSGTLPQVRIGGKGLSMRRVMWQLAHDRPVAAGRCITCACENSKCVHPDHLRASPINKAFRGVKKTLIHKTRIAISLRAGSKWSDEVMRDVAQSVGPVDEVAQKYGMDRSYVHRIRKVQSRRDLYNPYTQLLARAA